MRIIIFNPKPDRNSSSTIVTHTDLPQKLTDETTVNTRNATKKTVNCLEWRVRDSRLIDFWPTERSLTHISDQESQITPSLWRNVLRRVVKAPNGHTLLSGKKSRQKVQNVTHRSNDERANGVTESVRQDHLQCVSRGWLRYLKGSHLVVSSP